MLAIHCLCAAVPHMITVPGVACGPRYLYVLAYGNIRNMYRARPFGRLDTQLVWCTSMSSGAVVMSPYLTSATIGKRGIRLGFIAAASLSSRSHSWSMIFCKMGMWESASGCQPCG